MKNWKKLVALGMSAMMLASLAGCSTTSAPAEGGSEEAPAATDEGGKGGDMEGTHVFMFKSTGNSFGDLMYEGFAEYLEAKGEKTAYKSPAETTVAAQVDRKSVV